MSETRPPRSKAAERRRARRHPATRLSSVRASILAGPDVEVINVSPQGVLVASNVRLMPGAGICLNVWSNGQHHLLSGRIARVDTSIERGRAKYNAGIALDSAFPVFDLPAPADEGTPAVGEHTAGDPAAAEVPGSKAPARDTQAELTALREALQDQRSREQTLQRTVDMLKAALSSSERARKSMDEDQAAQRAAWAEERQRLQVDAEGAASHAGKLDAEVTALRERERSLVRALEEERAMLAGLLREKEQLLADLEAVRAEAVTAAQTREDLKKELAQRGLDAQKFAAQLEATEAWCADQQDLIYQVREDMLRSCALLEGWQSSRRTDLPVGRVAEPEPAEEPRPAPAQETARASVKASTD